MEKKIEDYLHLYLGCKVEYDGRIGVIHQYYLPAGKHMVGKVWVCSLEEDGNREMSCSASADKCKPILRPLTDMTEEELQQMKLIGWCHFDDEKIFVCEVHSGYEPHEMSSILNALRKNGFDCDNLIDSGLAITKPKN
jgi:hypothetical protein